MTETGGQGSDWTASLSSEQAAGFLRALVEDDEFRARLESGPERALAEHGIAAPPAVLPGPVRLPPKEDLIWAFRSAFPEWPRPSVVSRIAGRLTGRARPDPPPFGGPCLCWAFAYLAASKLRPERS